MAPGHCQPTAFSPAPPSTPGIALALAPRPLAASPLLLHGSFHLPLEEALALGEAVHRGLVLLVQRGAAHGVYVPFRDQVLFADDVQGRPAGVEGYFVLDVFELQGGFAPGDYFLSVSLGERLSPVVAVRVS